MYEGFQLRKEIADENLKLARQTRIEELEAEVFETAGQIVGALFDFQQVRHDQTEPPPSWVEQYGVEGAKSRLAVARAGWLPPSQAPVAVNHAVKMMIGVNRGRNYRMKLTQNNINVKLNLPAPTSREHPGPITYETRDLDE